MAALSCRGITGATHMPSSVEAGWRTRYIILHKNTGKIIAYGITQAKPASHGSGNLWQQYERLESL